MFDADKIAKMEARVQKLIAQAESTDNSDEANTFMAAAEELMTRYAIDRSRLIQESGKKEDILSVSFAYPHAAMYWATDKSGAAIVNKAIGLCGIAVHNSGKLIFLYGTRQDVEYTKTIILSVWKQQRKHMRLWKKTQPYVKALSGADLRHVEKGFYLGFARGAAEKITTARETVEADTGGALVLVSRRADIAEAMSGTTRRSAGRRLSYSGIGFGEGEARGRTASLGAELGGARQSLTT